MDYKGPHGIIILEGIEAVRRRPEMYIGGVEVHPSPRVRLLEYVVDDITHEPQAEVRILLWCEGAITIAYDGSPLPIEPFRRPVDGVAHPALYESFMYLFAGGMVPFGTSTFGPVLNALSERLVVKTMHGGDCYRSVHGNDLRSCAVKSHRIYPCSEPSADDRHLRSRRASSRIKIQNLEHIGGIAADGGDVTRRVVLINVRFAVRRDHRAQAAVVVINIPCHTALRVN